MEDLAAFDRHLQALREFADWLQAHEPSFMH
jgi:hypothetical protein